MLNFKALLWTEIIKSFDQKFINFLIKKKQIELHEINVYEESINH